jgi:hypothetical protein
MLDGAMKIAFRGFERDGDYGTIRLARAEEGEKGFELLKFNDDKPLLDLPLSDFEVVDEYPDDDTGEWVIRFKLPRKK